MCVVVRQDGKPFEPGLLLDAATAALLTVLARSGTPPRM